ncbi:phage tail protein [Methylocystis sp. S23]
MFALLGAIPIGLSPLTGPTEAGGSEKATLARIDVATGKPALQDMGDDLAGKKLSFFFCESFCDPESEMGRLREARRARTPLPYVPGDGAFAGVRFIVESIDDEIRKTTPAGRVVRIEAHLTLIEAPVQNLEGLAQQLQQAVAPARAANAALNVLARR